MPLKKRGGGVTKLPQPEKKELPNPKAPVKKLELKKPATQPKPKPVVKIRKRSPVSSQYVYLDNGLVVVKTPPACAKWDHNFRLRIIRDYAAPRSLRLTNQFIKHYENMGGATATYKIQGVNVQVHQPYEVVTESPNHVIVTRTDVVNVDTGSKLFLYHPDPAMRVLMVYCFLTGEMFGGLPKLRIAEADSE